MDPLSDPRFPDRPQHPDFWSITEVSNKLDGDVTEGGQSLPQILIENEIVDVNSLTYWATNRARQACQLLGLPEEKEASLASLYIDAFSVGTLVERKRHVPAEFEDTSVYKPILTQADMKAAVDNIDVQVEMMLLNHPTWVVVQWQEKDAHDKAPTIYGPFAGQTEAMLQRDRHHRLAMDNWLPDYRHKYGDPVTHMAPLWPAEPGK